MCISCMFIEMWTQPLWDIRIHWQVGLPRLYKISRRFYRGRRPVNSTVSWICEICSNENRSAIVLGKGADSIKRVPTRNEAGVPLRQQSMDSAAKNSLRSCWNHCISTALNLRPTFQTGFFWTIYIRYLTSICFQIRELRNCFSEMVCMDTPKYLFWCLYESIHNNTNLHTQIFHIFIWNRVIQTLFTSRGLL
jgi:hypothetical protein